MPKNNINIFNSNTENNKVNNFNHNFKLKSQQKFEHIINYNTDDFNFIRVATVSPVIHLGNISQNVFEIQNLFEKLNQNNVNITVFPELTLTGYTIGDLIFQREILENSKLGILKLAKLSEEVNSILIVGLPLEINNRIFNAAAVIYNGEILGFVAKTYLSNSREYYEERWFATANDLTEDYILLDGNKYIIGNDLVFSVINQNENNINNYLKFGIEICEDLWSIKPPSDDLALNGAELIFNLSTSSEVIGKSDYRRNLVKMQSAKTMSAYIYCSSNMYEASNDLTFAGHNIIVENGEILLESDKFNFEGEFNVVDIDLDIIRNERTKNHTFGRTKASKKAKEIIFEYSGFEAQNNFLRAVNKDVFFNLSTNSDEFVKNVIEIQSNALISKLKKINKPVDSSKVVIGVSGGLDSTYALLITQIAFLKSGIDPKNIYDITMPGFGTSESTKSSAISLAQFLSNSLLEIPINQAVELHFKDLNYDKKSLNTVFENSQARERTQILMDFANSVNGIVIGTGDLSELAIGWCTYNADHVSMYNLNGGIPKTVIKYIIKYFSNIENLKKYNILDNTNGTNETIDLEKFCSLLNKISNTEVSPELLPLENGEITQKTEEIVGPYELIDFFLFYFVKYGFKPSKILFYSEIAFENLYDKSTLKKWLKLFLKRFFTSQYKRNLMPDTIKVFPIALSPRGDWRAPSELDFNNWLDELEQEEYEDDELEQDELEQDELEQDELERE